MKARNVKPGMLVKDADRWQVVDLAPDPTLVAFMYTDGSISYHANHEDVEAVKLTDAQMDALKQAASSHALRHVMHISKAGRYWAGGGSAGWKPATIRPLVDYALIACEGTPDGNRVDIYRLSPSGEALLRLAGTIR